MCNRLLFLTALVGLAGICSAQISQKVPGKVPGLAQNGIQPHGSLKRYTLDFETGVLVEDTKLDAQSQGLNAVSTLAYDNSCTSGFFTTVTPGSEFLDWGVKSAGLSTLVDSFSFGYATFESDTSIGGPGASVEVAFHTGTTGFGIPGMEVARFAFSGLPGSTTGAPAGFLITVNLTGAGQFCLPDGAIGFSFCSFDSAGTGPLIGDSVACPNGQANAFDIYACPPPGMPLDPGTYAGTFDFGAGGPSATWVFTINEDDGSVLATVSEDLCASPTNPDHLTSGGVAPVINTIWPLMVFEDTIGPPKGFNAASVAAFYAGRFPCGTLILPAFGEVLIDITSPQILVQSVFGAGGVFDHSVAVPKDTSLIGLSAAVQSVQVGGGSPVSMSNLVEIVIGF